jgi:3-hydroxybutyrate dehydrogenase/gluconate 5-dehydrogenase
MDTSLDGKRALVTGASGGIGRAICEAFVTEGARVVAHARSRSRADELAHALRTFDGETHTVAADLCDSGAIAPMCDRAIDILGGIDIVVNNAGVYDRRSIDEMDESYWDLNFAVHAKAPYLITKYTAPAMIAQGQGGSLIYTASTSSRTADAGFAAYNASKHAVVGLMKCVAAEFGEHGIRANAIAPGWVDTTMAVNYLSQSIPADDGEFASLYERELCANMLGNKVLPTDIADMAVFLAGERSRCITAQTLFVCAGLVVS